MSQVPEEYVTNGMNEIDHFMCGLNPEQLKMLDRVVTMATSTETFGGILQGMIYSTAKHHHNLDPRTFTPYGQELFGDTNGS